MRGCGAPGEVRGAVRDYAKRGVKHGHGPHVLLKIKFLKKNIAEERIDCDLRPTWLRQVWLLPCCTYAVTRLRQSLLLDRILALPVTLCTLYARSAAHVTIAVAWRSPCSPKFTLSPQPSCRAVPQGVDLLVREDG